MGLLSEERGVTPEELAGFRRGLALCDAVQEHRKRPPMPANVELGICAGTATNLRDLLVAVLAGDAEAVALAKEIVGA